MIYLFKNILGIILLSFFNHSYFHSIHISYGEAVVKENEFYGKLTFYYDDFMLALKNWKGNLKNLNAEEYTELKNSYLQNHLTIIINGNKKLEPIISGNNGNSKSIWFEFRFKSSEKINKIKLKYDVLMNEYNDQLNLLNVSSSSGNQSLIFSGSKRELIIL